MDSRKPSLRTRQLRKLQKELKISEIEQANEEIPLEVEDSFLDAYNIVSTKDGDITMNGVKEILAVMNIDQDNLTNSELMEIEIPNTGIVDFDKLLKLVAKLSRRQDSKHLIEDDFSLFLQAANDYSYSNSHKLNQQVISLDKLKKIASNLHDDNVSEEDLLRMIQAITDGKDSVTYGDFARLLEDLGEI